MKLKRIITLCAALLLVTGVAVQTTSAVGTPDGVQGGFKDMPVTYWAYPYVSELEELGIISGYPDGTFRPNGKVTVAECVTMVVRAAMSRDDSAYLNDVIKLLPPKTDTLYGTYTEDHWASAYIETAKHKYIYSEDNTLNNGQGIDDPATRLQMAMFLDRVMKFHVFAGFNPVEELLGIDTRTFDENGYPIDVGTFRVDRLYGYDAKFNDVWQALNNGAKPGYPAITTNEVRAITRLYMYGIVTGYPDGTFGYNDTITRAEATTLIWRLLHWETLERGEKPPRPVSYKPWADMNNSSGGGVIGLNYDSSRPTPVVTVNGGREIEMNVGETITVTATVKNPPPGKWTLSWTVVRGSTSILELVGDLSKNEFGNPYAYGMTATIHAKKSTFSGDTQKGYNFKGDISVHLIDMDSGLIYGLPGYDPDFDRNLFYRFSYNAIITVYPTSAPPPLYPLKDIDFASIPQSLTKGMTTEEFQQAYYVAHGIASKYMGMGREDMLKALYDDLYEFSKSVAYSTLPHYNDVYGFYILKYATCAGCTRAVGLCLAILDIPFEHVNENQNNHQWCRIPVGNEYWICDPYGMTIGPEPGPYKHKLAS